MKTKNNGQFDNLKEGFAFKYLHKQFPWLSESDVLKAIEIHGSNADHVIKYLSSKRAKENTVDQN